MEKHLKMCQPISWQDIVLLGVKCITSVTEPSIDNSKGWMKLSNAINGESLIDKWQYIDNSKKCHKKIEEIKKMQELKAKHAKTYVTEKMGRKYAVIGFATHIHGWVPVTLIQIVKFFVQGFTDFNVYTYSNWPGISITLKIRGRECFLSRVRA